MLSATALCAGEWSGLLDSSLLSDHPAWDCPRSSVYNTPGTVFFFYFKLFIRHCNFCGRAPQAAKSKIYLTDFCLQMRSIPRNPPKPIWQTFVCQLASIPGPMNKPLTDFCLSIFVSQTWGPLTDFCLSNCSTGKGASGGVPSCYGCRWQTFVCQIWSTGSDVGCHWQTFVCQIWSTGGGMLPLTDLCLSNLIRPPRLGKNYVKIHRFWTLLGLPGK